MHIRLTGKSGQELFVNAEQIRGILPEDGGSHVVFGDESFAVRETPAEIAAKIAAAREAERDQRNADLREFGDAMMSRLYQILSQIECERTSRR